jgi:phage terminase small subunit
MEELSEKQKRFVNEYLIDLNATQAAIRAGYSKKTANEQASRLLANVNVSAYVEKKQERLAKKAEISQEWVNNLKKVFERCMQEESVTDKEGNFSGVYEFAHSGATKSLELLGKHLGMFSERIKHSGDEDGDPIRVQHRISTVAINAQLRNILGKE